MSELTNLTEGADRMVNGAPDSPKGHRRISLPKNGGRCLLILVPYFWLLALFLIPFIIVVKISLSDTAIAMPPYLPTFNWSEGWAGFLDMISGWDLENFTWLMEDDLYWKSYLSSLEIALVSSLLALLLGYPIAYSMARAPSEWRPTLLMLIILPFWTSFLIRVYAWIGILKKEGLLNMVLMHLGIIDDPLTILNTDIAVYIGIVYSYLPFMVLPLYSSLEKMDDSLLEAATDLGCSPFKAFWLITVPLSMPGILAGCFLVFIPAVGEFVIPDLLGGSNTLMIGKTLWVEFFSNRDWPVASAVAVILLILLVVPIVLFQRMQEKQQEKEA
ncbi:ABC transporter permease subunit [uncultured Cohaesibacter sp.]|uniref:ABC transporter permease subunit n=1 Tax=uncultured Cohaesibacter sp. TaxID=1002546 RepID=UPI002AA8FAC8|nr:ABC transporter permease subunit [uncultured Cohaesibacter sp.]